MAGRVVVVEEEDDGWRGAKVEKDHQKKERKPACCSHVGEAPASPTERHAAVASSWRVSRREGGEGLYEHSSSGFFEAQRRELIQRETAKVFTDRRAERTGVCERGAVER